MKRIVLLLCMAFATNVFAAPEMKVNKAKIPKEVTLDPLFAEKEEGKFGIIGRDNRQKQWDTTQYPHTALGQLIMDNSTCSGSLIGPQHVLTAAHCVYGDGKFATSVFFAPGRSGHEFPFGLYKVTDIYMPREYLNPGQFNAYNVGDVAVLKLAVPAGEQLGWLGFRTVQHTTSADLDRINQHIDSYLRQTGGGGSQAEKINESLDELIYVVPEFKVTYMGYSGDKPNEMWGDSCIYISAPKNDSPFQFLQFFCDMNPGASGSGYFDDEFYITSVNSYHSYTDDSVVRDNQGRKTGFAKGNFDEVRNYSLAIDDYAYDLIDGWKRGRFGNETVHHQLNMGTADRIDTYKQFSLTNKCGDNIWIAARYRNLQNEWVNDGFYETAYDKRVSFGMSSDYFYYTAVSDNANWSGDDKVVEMYDRSYGLRKEEIANKSYYNINLTCN